MHHKSCSYQNTAQKTQELTLNVLNALSVIKNFLFFLAVAVMHSVLGDIDQSQLELLLAGIPGQPELWHRFLFSKEPLSLRILFHHHSNIHILVHTPLH